MGEKMYKWCLIKQQLKTLWNFLDTLIPLADLWSDEMPSAR